MRKIAFLGLLLQALVAVKSIAQDPHNSQYFNLPVYYNPAATGQGVEHIRLTGLYRNQWPSLGNAFTTQGIQFDKQVSRVGIGFMLLKNSAGPSSIQRIQFGGSLSYRLKFGSHQIASGLNIGFVQKSFDPSKMTFDEQFTDDQGYNANNPNNEAFAFTKVIRPDFGAGFLWTMGENSNSKWQPFAGASLMHINKAKEVFIEADNGTPIKIVLQAGAKYKASEKIDLKPSIMMQRQDYSNEMLIGCMVTLNLESRNKAEAGIYMRKKESAIIYGGYQWNSLMVGASYDMNIANSVSGPGAFELTLTYVPRARVKTEKKKKETKEKSTTVNTAPIQVENAEGLFDIDNDKDGVNNIDDQCPAEVGLKNNHGCPVSTIDADGDGIPNNVDPCPYIKGPASTNGCPDLDGDGVVDSKDHCPTRKGSKENNGCPDKKSEENIIDKTPFIKLKNIKGLNSDGIPTVKFDINESTIIDVDIISVLEPLSDEIYKDTTLQLLITGHTDAEGDEQYNMILSQSRADAVAEYLVNHGINASRIQTVGYGETTPVNSNNSEESRALNRRAEVYVKRNP